MIWIIVIVGVLILVFLSGFKFNPDPHFHKWQLVDKTTKRWKDYCICMMMMTSDSLLSIELQRKVLVDGIWKKFYQWVSDWDLFHKLDYWDWPDEVWFRGTADCDGFARFVCDVLGRFAKYLEVWWLEVYGFYRKYYQDSNGNWHYKVVAGGHAICVYKRDGKLLAFSNTSWWHDQNFQDFIEIGEQTFPEGLYWVICRHWETGKALWIRKAKSGEILEGTNIFHRKLKLIRNLKLLKRGEKKRIEEFEKRTVKM